MATIRAALAAQVPRQVNLQAFISLSPLSPSPFHYYFYLKCVLPPLSHSFFLSSSLRFFGSKSSSKYSISEYSILLQYLTDTFNIPKTRAMSVLKHYARRKSVEGFQQVVQFFTNLGFSDDQIVSCVSKSPSILFLNVDKILKPKLEYVQQLGLPDAHLGEFFPKNHRLLTCSLVHCLKPSVEVIKEVLLAGSTTNVDEDLLRIMWRSRRFALQDPKLKLCPNISFIRSCGIVGRRLSNLLKARPSLFTLQEAKLRGIVSKALEMGIPVDSPRLSGAIFALSCTTDEALMKKLEIFKNYGFSEEELLEMFGKRPTLFALSEKTIRQKIEFFLNEVKFQKSGLVKSPVCLTYSLEGRVAPRHRVLQLVQSKRLLPKEPSFPSVLLLTDKKFSENFILRFEDHAQELSMAYKG